MEQEEDDYSDRDASGEDDTDFVEANLSGKANVVLLDPALAGPEGSVTQDLPQNVYRPPENRYPPEHGDYVSRPCSARLRRHGCLAYIRLALFHQGVSSSSTVC